MHSHPEQWQISPLFLIFFCYFPRFPYFALLNARETNCKTWEARKIYVIRELAEKELVEDCASLIIKSLVSLSEIISSFLFRKFLRVLYTHQKYTMAFSSNTNLVFRIALKIGGFYISFPSIFKIIFHNLLCCFRNSCFKNVIHSRKLHAYCHVPNYNGVKFYF